MKFDPTDKVGFEKWARGQGMNLEPVGAGMRTRGGVPLPTYFEDATEFAWRGWANRPHRTTRIYGPTHWPTPCRALPSTFEALREDQYHGLPPFGQVPSPRKTEMNPALAAPYGLEAARAQTERDNVETISAYDPVLDEGKTLKDCRLRFEWPAFSGTEPSIPSQPIPMILHCPKCGTQHVDAPKSCNMGAGCNSTGVCYADAHGAPHQCPKWDNPPHRSHLCANCGTVWRPADVCTTGVLAVETKGKSDTWSPA